MLQCVANVFSFAFFWRKRSSGLVVQVTMGWAPRPWIFYIFLIFRFVKCRLDEVTFRTKTVKNAITAEFGEEFLFQWAGIRSLCDLKLELGVVTVLFYSIFSVNSDMISYRLLRMKKYSQNRVRYHYSLKICCRICSAQDHCVLTTNVFWRVMCCYCVADVMLINKITVYWRRTNVFWRVMCC